MEGARGAVGVGGEDGGRATAGGRVRRPPDPLAGAGGTRCRLVRGRGVLPRGGAGDEGGGWRREYPPGGSPTGGSAPRAPRNGLMPGIAVPGGAGSWGDGIRPSPQTPLRSALSYGECVSRGEGHPPLSILSPPHGPRQPGYVLGSCGTRSPLVRGRGVWLWGAAGDEGGGWRREYPPGVSRKGGTDQHSDRVNASLGRLRRPGWRPCGPSHFEGGGTLPPRFFPLPNGQDVVGAFSEGPPERRGGAGYSWT